MAKQPPDEAHRRRAAKLWPMLEAPLREAARAHGYALGVHGSLVRDFDIIAVPWSDDVAPPLVLAEVIRAAAERTVGGAIMAPLEEADLWFRVGSPGAKPHGRLVWSFHLGGGPYIDLSVVQAPFQESYLMSERRNLAAFTAATPNYPAYIKISRVDGAIEVTVRAPATPDGRDGTVSMIRLAPEDFAKVAREALDALDQA